MKIAEEFLMIYLCEKTVNKLGLKLITSEETNSILFRVKHKFILTNSEDKELFKSNYISEIAIYLNGYIDGKNQNKSIKK